MASLFYSKLGTVRIDNDPVKDGPTRGPSFHALWRSCREIPDKCTVCFTNWFRILHQWLGAASTWEGYLMSALERWELTMIL